MSQWRRIAIKKFPRLQRKIADAEGAKWVWFELLLEFAWQYVLKDRKTLDTFQQGFAAQKAAV